MTGFWRKTAASCLAAAMCATSLPAADFATVFAATAADRTDNSIVYFVDCGDYVVNTVGEGEQFGTHNSVTDQAYGEDPQTGYQWGIVDQAEELAGNNIKNPSAPDNGGVYTANTWAFESNPNHTDVPKTSSNRYSKNFYEKDIAERFVDYAFELEEGAYEVTVGCSNPWNCSNTPVVKAIVETSGEETVISEEGFRIPNGGNNEAEGIVNVPAGGDKLTVDVRGTTDDNKAVNVAYILIRSVKSGETDDEKKIRKDLQILTLPETAREDIILPAKGENGSTITWESKNKAVISNTGKVTRPEAEDALVEMEATLSCGTAEPQKKTFTVKVPALNTQKPIDREDNDIIYFVDCGDYVVDTVSEGDQLGTHNSVTDQVYGEDPQTGYHWGIVDTVSNPLKNGTHACGGAFTDNTWPFEQNKANTDVPKTSSNRYTKNQFESGITERYLDYKFEVENGKYDVFVCCVDPWDVSKSPDVYLNFGKENQTTVKKGLNASAAKPVKQTIEITDKELTVNLRGTGDDNKAINLAYILIRKYKELTLDEESGE